MASKIRRRNLVAFSSCKSILLSTLIVFSVIDDFAHIQSPNLTQENTSGWWRNKNHSTSLTHLNYKRRNGIIKGGSYHDHYCCYYYYHSNSTLTEPNWLSYSHSHSCSASPSHSPPSCTCSCSSSSSPSLLPFSTTTPFSQTTKLQHYQIKRKQSFCFYKSETTTSMLFNNLINNSLKWRLDNDAINKPRESSLHFLLLQLSLQLQFQKEEIQDKSQSASLETSLMSEQAAYYFSGMLFSSLRKLISRFNYPRIVKANAIRLLRLDVPHSIQEGQPLRLRCIYETKGEKLQSLSWYKNGREFYRYQPFERKQPVLAFKLNGVNVDMSKSRNSTVLLTNTTSETSGRYKCEATGTTFQEVNMETYVNVLSVPLKANSVNHPPTITLEKIMILVMVTTLIIKQNLFIHQRIVY